MVGNFVQKKSLKLDIFLGLKFPHCDKLKSSLSLGTISGSYDTVIDVGNVTSFMVTGLANDVPHYFVVQAYNQGGIVGLL